MKRDYLAAILKEVGFNNDMFAGRLIFQKTIYILKEMGLDLDYSYNLYMNGPYCSPLAKDGYTLAKNGLETDTELSKEDMKIIENFKEMVSGNEKNPIWFEMAGTYMFLKKERGKSDDEAFDMMVKRHSYLDKRNMFNEIKAKLKSRGLVG